MRNLIISVHYPSRRGGESKRESSGGSDGGSENEQARRAASVSACAVVAERGGVRTASIDWSQPCVSRVVDETWC